ncbi:hypothetical protein GGQ66_004186 [Rhizobium borbori]|uniref:Uncharacterized protein n=1 Tax=Allorhizobium borbori TaxID=485907 RepID=A0A7W6K5I8_9HYPH|nr:hypothetical protein [Allorhizobium borbori]
MAEAHREKGNGAQDAHELRYEAGKVHDVSGLLKTPSVICLLLSRFARNATKWQRVNPSAVGMQLRRILHPYA